MILKVTAGQAGRVRKLARGKCCNCVNGNCLLLDDGGENRCVQLISCYGVYCTYFLHAVLPGDRELYTEILQHNHLKI